jgi:amidase/aspartyl-tRNA(Asn)/glutamyl-tRNA(Gln) amidotransferase subunit A
MNSSPYWSISDWTTHAQEDPESCAGHFLNHLAQLDKGQVRAAIARTPSRKKLIQAFELSADNTDGALTGVPYLLKDLYDVAGWETNASSLFLNDIRSTPSTTSALAQSFNQAGGVFAGKTHLVEFAYGMEGSNCHFGDGVHPHFPERVSGGSSSGSVWAVANGLVPLASGSDTGGSVRVPAAYNGLFGLRVTPDHPWSKEGCFPLSPSFDTAGWFTRSAEDMTITMNALFQNEPTAANAFRGIELLPHYKFLDERLSIPHQRAIDSISLTTNSAATQALHSLPDLVKPYLIISSSEAMQVHQDWHEERKDQYDPQTWERIDKGKQWTPEDLHESRSVIDQVRHFFDSLFEEYDFAVLPASPVPAPLLGQATELREAQLRLTTPGSLSQLPILTIPYFMDSGLSGGLQIIVPDLSSTSIAIWKELLND